MLYAKFTKPNSGYDGGKFARDRGLVVGEAYEVTHVAMGQSYTNIYLAGFGGKLSNGFNSVYFEFYEDAECTEPVNIYEDARYNPYW